MTLYNVMFLVIDIGNTTQKIAIFDASGEEKAVCRHKQLDISELKILLKRYNIEAAIVSAVGSVDEELVAWLDSQIRLLRFSSALKLPIRVDYGTPDTLGTDRIASAVGAWEIFPQQNTLVIQAGTCLVADFVDANGVYQGGSIAPGLRMRFQSLHDHTAHLPLLEPQEIDFLVGKTTQESILSGVIQGISSEIDGLIHHYRKFYPETNVVLTGGDADFLKDFIKNRIFAAPNLVLRGLYKILRNNVE